MSLTPWYPDYPDSWDWTDVTDDVDDVLADHVNRAYAELRAIGDSLIDVTDVISVVDGNVGIGVATPEEKLDVNGNVRVQQENAFRFGGTGEDDYEAEIKWNESTQSLDFNFAA